jgi:chromosome partitioning protein
VSYPVLHPPPDGAAPPKRITRVIAIANQKGGVGKTTTAVNLGAALAMNGEPVLLIDLDPQGNASTGLGISRSERTSGSYSMLMGNASLANVTRPTLVANLALIPAEADLAGAEIELVNQPRRQYQLKDAISSLRVGSGPTYSFVLIDCPPSLGLLTLNALVAADAVLVPLQCEFYALEGLTGLADTIETVRRALNPSLRIHGILLTMYDRRNNLSEDVAADARGYYARLVYDTVIPRNIRISEAPSHSKPVLLYDPRSLGAHAYIKLAAEVLTRERGTVTSAGVS